MLKFLCWLFFGTPEVKEVEKDVVYVTLDPDQLEEQELLELKKLVDKRHSELVQEWGKTFWSNCDVRPVGTDKSCDGMYDGVASIIKNQWKGYLNGTMDAPVKTRTGLFPPVKRWKDSDPIIYTNSITGELCQK